MHVGLGYATRDFRALLDARVYPPQEWADDPARRKKKCMSRTKLAFKRSPGSRWNLHRLLCVAFSRWSIEACFREAKEELGFDHYECRGWRCIHRHLACAILNQLFCARTRQQLSPTADVLSGEQITLEQVRRATSAHLQALGLPPRLREAHCQRELDEPRYSQQRNAAASESHRKKRIARYLELRIDPDKIKSCLEPEGDS